MAGSELNVKDIMEIKRLWKLGMSSRKISKIVGAHRNTINKYVDAFKQELIIDDSVKILHPISEILGIGVDWEKVRSDFLGGIPLTIIHEELLERNEITATYSGFWRQVQKNTNLSTATMVRIFKPGERTEIDYADGINVLDPATGEIRETEFFVGVLCHSRYAFAEFTWTQSSHDFLESHVNMFEFFGGTTELLSPDNLKSAVTKAHRYDPTINQAYTRLADYYDLAVVPARVRTPQDKAIVERTIQIFQRYFFMKVRNRTFTSLLELNQCLREHLEIFNQKVHRIFRRSRKEMYLEEKCSLRPLPVDRYKVATHHSAKLGRDCHLTFEDNFYSSPHTLRGNYLDIWASSKSIEIFHAGSRVAFHARSQTKSKFITDNIHYPPAHQAYLEEDVQKLIERAVRTGTHTEALVKGLLEGKHPLRHLRRCQGIVALAWKYTPELLESACEMGNRFSNYNVQYLERVIKARKGVASRSRNASYEAPPPQIRASTVNAHGSYLR